jgi:hypothetical protein
MAITYPRFFPTGLDCFVSGSFHLAARDAVNETRGGGILSIEIGDAHWEAAYETVPYKRVDRAVWQAWWATLRSHFTFLGYDPEKRFPLNYGKSVLNLLRAGGGAFDGSLIVSSATATTLTLSGLPANFIFLVGDHVSVGLSGGRLGLHQIVEPATGSAGGVATVTVEPRIRTANVVPGSTTANLVKPLCEMFIKPGSFAAPHNALERLPVTFEAVQRLA